MLKLIVLQSLSVVAEKQGYIRPTLTDGSRIVEIKGGRHAVVEAVMGAQEYVPNDIDCLNKQIFNSSQDRICQVNQPTCVNLL